jgi:hypothetical protein
VSGPQLARTPWRRSRANSDRYRTRPIKPTAGAVPSGGGPAPRHGRPAWTYGGGSHDASLAAGCSAGTYASPSASSVPGGNARPSRSAPNAEQGSCTGTSRAVVAIRRATSPGETGRDDTCLRWASVERECTFRQPGAGRASGRPLGPPGRRRDRGVLHRCACGGGAPVLRSLPLPTWTTDAGPVVSAPPSPGVRRE